MKPFTLHTFNGHVFTGRVIGASTSEAADHNHREDYLKPSAYSTTDRRVKCSACRWQETTLYETEAGGFVVHTNGRSIVPGESDRVRVTFTGSAYEVVEILTIQGVSEPFIPSPSARALAQAASVNDDVQEAYVNRAVLR